MNTVNYCFIINTALLGMKDFPEIKNSLYCITINYEKPITDEMFERAHLYYQKEVAKAFMITSNIDALVNPISYEKYCSLSKELTP